MKRILMFGWELPPFNSGGLGVACYGLARALVRTGFDIVFVLPRKVDVDPSFMDMRFAASELARENQSVSVRSIETLLTPYITSEQFSMMKQSDTTQLYQQTLHEEVMAYAQKAGEIAAQEQCDFIYAHDWLSFPAGLAAKEVTGKPLIAQVHATEYDRGAGGADERIVKVEKQGLEQADHIIAVSKYTKSVIMDRYGIEDDKIDVVYNGVDREDFVKAPRSSRLLRGARKQGKKVVLFVGRLTAQKGFEYFLEAAAKALAHNPDLLFVVAGSGELEAPMMHRAAELKIADKVLFMGFVRGKELQEAYGAADLFVMPSVSEPFGITTLEAMLHGTPVIVSRQSGVAEVAEHTLKVDFWDTEDLAHKMLAVVENEALQKQLRRNGAREVRQLTWKESAKQCAWVFDNRFTS